VTNAKSFKNLNEWLQKIREYSDEHIVVALVGNKKDLVEDKDPVRIDYNIDDLFTGYIESQA
jgi:GTPase SAR1 family protein